MGSPSGVILFLPGSNICIANGVGDSRGDDGDIYLLVYGHWLPGRSVDTMMNGLESFLVSLIFLVCQV